MLGGGAAQTIARLFGHGDYSVVANNSVIQGQAVASFQNNGRGLNLCHREFISNVVGSVGFELTSYPINPALPQTFPFLSQIASLFEEYEFRGLVFEFVTTSGVVSATSAALGSVVMATDYDSYSENFATKQQMESYQFAISTVPCQNAAHGVECDNREKTSRNLYTRTGPYKGSLLDYDFGKFQIATVGMPSQYTVGELWVTYDVRLLKPRLKPGLSSRVPLMDAYSISTTSSSTGYVGWIPLGSELISAARASPSNSLTLFDVTQGLDSYRGETLGYDPTSRNIYLLAPCQLVFVIEILAPPGQLLMASTGPVNLTAGNMATTSGSCAATVGSAISLVWATFGTGVAPGAAGTSAACQVTNTSDVVFGSRAMTASFTTVGPDKPWGSNARPLSDYAFTLSQGAYRLFDNTSTPLTDSPVASWWRVYDILMRS